MVKIIGESEFFNTVMSDYILILKYKLLKELFS